MSHIFMGRRTGSNIGSSWGQKNLPLSKVTRNLLPRNSAYKAGMLASSQGASQKEFTRWVRLARIHSKDRAYHPNIRNGVLPGQIIPLLAIKAQEKKMKWKVITPRPRNSMVLGHWTRHFTVLQECSLVSNNKWLSLWFHKWTQKLLWNTCKDFWSCQCWKELQEITHTQIASERWF